MGMTEQGYAVNRSMEGRALRAYRDPGGVLTIGYGSTNMDSYVREYLGRPIALGMVITEAQAEHLMKHSFERNYEPAVRRALPGAPPNAIDAGGLFHWNTGAVSRAAWPKIYTAQGAVPAVLNNMMGWIRQKGVGVLPGLVRRRKREFAILKSGDYGPEGRIRAQNLDTKSASAPDHDLAGTPGMLRQGDSGDEVKWLNDQLALLGFDVVKGPAFDAKTDAAVRAFQRSHPQLGPDGVVGPATRAALVREADAKRKILNGTIATGGPGTATIGIDQATGSNLPMIVYVGIGVVIVGLIAWYVWTYRDELRGLVARAATKKG